MRTFKPTYRNAQGRQKKVRRWWVELRDHNRIVRRFPAYSDRRQSEFLGRNIETLVALRANQTLPSGDVARWLEGISPKLREKLTSADIIDKRRAAAGKKLLDHLGDFEQSLLAKGNTKHHVELTRYRVEKLLDDCGFQTWTDINPLAVEQSLKRFRDAGLSKKTSNYYLRSIKQFCSWMVSNQLASESPLRSLGYAKVEKTELRVQRRSLEVAEIQKLLAVTGSCEDRYGMTGRERRLLYKLAIETGLRSNELRSLQVGSFDLDELTVTVAAGYSKNRREAVLPLRRDTAKELKMMLANKTPQTEAFRLPEKWQMAAMLRADVTDAKVSCEGVDFHSLRHTTGSLLAASGVHPKVAQTILRHSTIGLTMDIYTHRLCGQEAAAVEGLPALTKPDEKRQVKSKSGGAA